MQAGSSKRAKSCYIHSMNTPIDVADTIESNPLVLFMKGTRAEPYCGFSARTVAVLEVLEVDFVEVNIFDHPSIREDLVAYAQRPTTPQLFHNSELVGGCDIIEEMYACGELAAALGVEQPAGVIPTPRPLVRGNTPLQIRRPQ